MNPDIHYRVRESATGFLSWARWILRRFHFNIILPPTPRFERSRTVIKAACSCPVPGACVRFVFPEHSLPSLEGHGSCHESRDTQPPYRTWLPGFRLKLCKNARNIWDLKCCRREMSFVVLWLWHHEGGSIRLRMSCLSVHPSSRFNSSISRWIWMKFDLEVCSLAWPQNRTFFNILLTVFTKWRMRKVVRWKLGSGNYRTRRL